MTSQAGGILGRIVESKRERIEQSKRAMPLDRVRELAEDVSTATSLAIALRSAPGISVIAEMKRASPSGGELDPDMDPSQRATMYCDAGAAAISVLTEQDHFRGSLEDLRAVKQVAGPRGVAVLQKDFVFDEYQVYEARAAGADAVLLIIAILEPGQYRDLLELSRSLGMDALVEAFDEPELEIALDAGPDIVGINNRNLKTLETSLSVFEALSPRIESNMVKVAESGMKNAEDVRRMGRAGAKAVLVGESLMRAGDEAVALVKSMSEVRIS